MSDYSKTIRVFPRRTVATPTDSMAYVGDPPLLAIPEANEVHISCAFTYDMPEAERLYKAWSVLGIPVKVGGPAHGKPSGEHIPGMYVKPGIVFTSRGCPNNCWFCRVPKVEGKLREYTIRDGFNVSDDNLLACSDKHINAVFDMLKRQPERPILTGGLEAKLLKQWHINRLREIGTTRMYFAYDTPDDYEPLVDAGKRLMEAGYTFAGHSLMTYVLIGYPKDTFEKAEKRLIDTMRAGFWPMAMLWKDDDGNEDKEWRRFQGQWARTAVIYARLKSGEIKLDKYETQALEAQGGK